MRLFSKIHISHTEPRAYFHKSGSFFINGVAVDFFELEKKKFTYGAFGRFAKYDDGALILSGRRFRGGKRIKRYKTIAGYGLEKVHPPMLSGEDFLSTRLFDFRLHKVSMRWVVRIGRWRVESVAGNSERLEVVKDYGEQIAKLLEWSSQEYCNEQYDAGRFFAIRMQPYRHTQITKEKMYWNWWRNFQADFDERFLKTYGEEHKAANIISRDLGIKVGCTSVSTLRKIYCDSLETNRLRATHPYLKSSLSNLFKIIKLEKNGSN